MDSAKVFDCNICKLKYKSSYSLKTHIKSKHQGKTVNETPNVNIQDVEKSLDIHKVYDCNYCDMNFKYEISVKRHIRKYHQDKVIDSEIVPNVCNICGKKYSNSNYVQMHIKRFHMNNNVYECSICGKVITYKKSLKYHLKNVHPEHYSNDQIKSNEPETSSIFIVKDKSYLVNTNSNYSIECQICYKKFKTKNSLTTHIRKIHSEITNPRSNTIKCCVSNCDNSFATLQDLRTHLMELEEDGGHNFTIEKEEHVFNNIREFIQWKEDLEENENVRYIIAQKKTRKNGSYRSHYICSRSGKHRYQGTGKRSIKSQGSSKLEHHCPSSIYTFCDSDGEIKVTYYKQHFGHATGLDNVMHIPMHNRDRQYIKERIRDGVDISRIKEELNNKGGRSSFIKLQDIRNQLNIEERNTLNPISSEDHMDDRQKLIEVAHNLSVKVSCLVNRNSIHSNDQIKKIINLLKMAEKEVTEQANK
ncbi:unnamed protein product, partial [Meganyctiphanes norvegica]